MENRLSFSTTFTRQKYGWSKYGGANHGLVKEELPEWFCQGCGQKQVRGLPSYMIPMTLVDDRNFVRVCSKCENLLWFRQVEKHFANLKRLLELQTRRLF